MDLLPRRFINPLGFRLLRYIANTFALLWSMLGHALDAPIDPLDAAQIKVTQTPARRRGSRFRCSIR